MKELTIHFPRHAEDIYTQKRTLFHMLEERVSVGDRLLLFDKPTSAWLMSAKITKVDHVRLCDLTAEDLVLLNVDDAASYLARWDGMVRDLPASLGGFHPESLSSQNPKVYRIEFRYVENPMPEWCLAS